MESTPGASLWKAYMAQSCIHYMHFHSSRELNACRQCSLLPYRNLPYKLGFTARLSAMPKSPLPPGLCMTMQAAYCKLAKSFSERNPHHMTAEVHRFYKSKWWRSHLWMINHKTILISGIPPDLFFTFWRDFVYQTPTKKLPINIWYHSLEQNIHIYAWVIERVTELISFPKFTEAVCIFVCFCVSQLFSREMLFLIDHLMPANINLLLKLCFRLEKSSYMVK